MSLAATYSFNGGTVKTIPDGIFTGITALQINVASSKLSDTGTYAITLTVSESADIKSFTCGFSLEVTN